MRIRTAASIAVAGALVGLAAGTVTAQDILLERGGSRSRPPAPAGGERPRDHYTPYSPPPAESLPPDAKVHVIVTGDTLWDLARTYLGDPYLWPQIWEVNRYITDPHWIFPGDPLVIPAPMLIAEAVPVDVPLDLEMLPAPQPVAKRHDVYCAPYILYTEDAMVRRRGKRTRHDREMEAAERAAASPLEPSYPQADAMLTEMHEVRRPGGDTPLFGRRSKGRELVLAAPRIAAAEDQRRSFAEGDVVYINRGEVHGVTAGDEFLVVRPEGRVDHPVTSEPLGIAMQMMGLVRVLCTQGETATVKVITSCQSIELGDLIRPHEPIPIPLASEFQPTPAECTTLPDRPTGYLVYAKNNKRSVAEEDLVNIDLGSDTGLVPGDFLVVYRTSFAGEQYPPSILGDAVVLLVERGSATAKILASRSDMQTGDRVRLR